MKGRKGVRSNWKTERQKGREENMRVTKGQIPRTTKGIKERKTGGGVRNYDTRNPPSPCTELSHSTESHSTKRMLYFLRAIKTYLKVRLAAIRTTERPGLNSQQCRRTIYLL